MPHGTEMMGQEDLTGLVQGRVQSIHLASGKGELALAGASAAIGVAQHGEGAEISSPSPKTFPPTASVAKGLKGATVPALARDLK